MLEQVKKLILGEEKNPLDPHIFHKLSLVAFLAWVGIGADGISSACYGPEEAFLALGDHRFLCIFLALATAGTVFIISLGYSEIIELFPQGGGGYLVTTRLLGKYPGLLAGSALVVDYVLTISISIASGGDAFFSFLPANYLPYKFPFQVFLICLLIYLNLRGAKESIITLLPIFLTFMVTHLVLLAVIFVGHAPELGSFAASQASQVSTELATVGFLPLFLIFMRAYSMGAGTYTGIEAVSNSMQLLKEPKVLTGKKTMLYMAISLSVIAGGILIGYLLLDTRAEHGKTLNATLALAATKSWDLPGLPLGQIFSTITLISEAALLFVAAQAGFMGGPGVLSYMAIDSWFPKRFTYLSDRLVTKNGVLLMGLSALALLVYAKGSVKILVVMYSINVFITFSLALTGITLYRFKNRTKGWRRKILNTATGAILTTAILILMICLKFREGAWVTIVITSGVMGLCMLIHHHYAGVQTALKRLDETLTNIPFPPLAGEKPKFNPKGPTAAILVTGFNGLGIHSLLAVKQLFGDYFKNYIFLSVGVIDSSHFKGADQIEALSASTEESLKQYAELAGHMGMYSDYRFGLGTDVIDEIVELSQKISKEFKHVVFFGGQLVFHEENFFSKILHNQTTVMLQKRFHFTGLPMVVLPIRVM